MKATLKPLRDQVIVITGASSGIGLATARLAAREGAKLVLASRNQEALETITREIETQGGEAIFVAADVGQREDVRRIATRAIERFGGFDTWVNDAGIGLYGRLDEVSDEDHRRLFDTNFWGVVHGSLVACETLAERGGALINLGSVVSEVSVPLQGMYSASKHAVKGFTDALRMELEAKEAPVSVTLIKPASIDTPYPHHARNYMAEEPTLPPPVYAPEIVAEAILHAAQRPVRDLFVGGSGRVISALGKSAPRLYDRIGTKRFLPQQKSDERARDPQGSLHRFGLDGDVRGGHRGRVTESSLYTRAAMHPVAAGAALAAGVAAIALIAIVSTREPAHGLGEGARDFASRLRARAAGNRFDRRLARRFAR